MKLRTRLCRDLTLLLLFAATTTAVSAQNRSQARDVQRLALSESVDDQDSDVEADAMSIRLRMGDTLFRATLADNPTAQAFTALLPLTLTLRDYAETEKVSDLPERLPTEGSPQRSAPDVGTLAHYAPWGNLAIFYQNFSRSNGLIPLGVLESGVERFAGPDTLEITIDQIDQGKSRESLILIGMPSGK